MKDVEKVVVLGTGPAGLTAAIYLARAQINPLVVDGASPGGQLMITSEVENYPGFPEGITGPELVERVRKQAERFGARFMFGRVTVAELRYEPLRLDLESGEQVRCQALIISTGATARWLGLESETALRGAGVSACATCDGFFFQGKHVLVVGGGDTAMEDALHLTHFASRVTVVHRRGELRASKYMAQKAMEHEKIDFIWDSVIEEIRDAGQKRVTGVMLRNVRSGQPSELACDGVFVAIGHQPNTRCFTGQLDMDENGYLITRPRTTKTNLSGVFAAGDVADLRYRQAITAAGSGCMAAIDAERYLGGEPW
ncbi:MAG: thioredoxin-disulfide reductase [Candidatus Eisenbacteria bacterium]